MSEYIDQSEPEVEAEVPESTESSTVDQPELESDPSSDEGDSPVVDDSEEIEHDGEKYKVPKALKEAFMKNADYTRKTQEVAEARRSFEADQQQFQRAVQVQQQSIQEVAKIYALDEQIKQYQGVDWSKPIDTDPVEAMKLDRHYRSLVETRDQTASRVQQMQQESVFTSQQATAKALEQGREQLSREIAGWSPEVAKNLTSFGKTIGFSEAELGLVTDPRAVKLLHKAYLYDQMMQKATKTPVAPKVAVTPITKVTAKSETVGKNPDKMSVTEWTKWRNNQIKRGK